jgi:tetratricopeptide (TPR) repeat protein
MKNIIYTLALLISFSSFGQFSNEDLDKIINERTWCLTNITVDGKNDRPDGKWVYISGMNIVNGEDDYIAGVEDILIKKYTEDGISITVLENGSELTLNLKIPKENHSLMADGENEITNLKDTYVELILSFDNSLFEARLTCTSLIGRRGSLPIKNWNGKNEQEAERYFNRGIDKAEANDHLGAIADFTKSIVLDPDKETIAYGYRGFSKEEIGDLTGACADWKKSVEFGGDEDSFYAVADKCN